MMYCLIGWPPSLSGSFQEILQELAVWSDTTRGPLGADGGPREGKKIINCLQIVQIRHNIHDKKPTVESLFYFIIFSFQF